MPSKRITVEPGKTDADYIKEMANVNIYTLLVNCEVQSPPFVYRRCKTIPTDKQAELVWALSGGQQGVRSYSGRRTSSCDQYYYLGWNVMGYQFENGACYCHCCGYGLDDVARAELVIASKSLGESYLERLKFMCEKAYVPIEVEP